jgi:hypothetical protein
MRKEASALKIGDLVLVRGQGEREVVRCQESGPDILVWFRGDEANDEPSMAIDFASCVELTRPREQGPAGPALRVVQAEPSPVAQVEARGPGRPADRKRQADTLRQIAGRLLSCETTRRDFDEALADAMLCAAQRVERGELPYMARLTSRPQLDDLEAALADARHERQQRSTEPIEGRPELADMPFVRFTGVVIWARDLAELLVHAKDRVDAGRLSRVQLLTADEERRLELTGNDIDLVRALLVRDGKAKLSPQIQGIARQLKRHDRLGRLGIRDTASLRAALREYLGCWGERTERANQIEQPPLRRARAP